MPASPCVDCRTELAAYRGRCPDCARRWNADTHRTGRLEPKSGRMYGTRRWQVTRRRQLFREPLCAHCGELATDVHHRHGVAADPWSLDGLESLCHACHSRVTRREQLGVSSGRG